MKVDRAGFLLFTSAIFAACGSNQESANAPGGPVAIPVQPPPPASTPSADPKLADAPPDAGKPKESVPVAAADDDEEPYKPWPGTANPPLAKTVHAQSCDVSENAKGKILPCLLKAAPGPSCESFSETKADCPKMFRWLVPKVAEKAAACLNAKSGKTDICLFNVGPSCVIEALSNVCLDTNTKIADQCKRVMTKCQSIDKEYRHMTLDACKAAMSAIVPASQQKFVHCAAESCDLVPCVYAAQR